MYNQQMRPTGALHEAPFRLAVYEIEIRHNKEVINVTINAFSITLAHKTYLHNYINKYTKNKYDTSMIAVPKTLINFGLQYLFCDKIT